MFWITKKIEELKNNGNIPDIFSGNVNLNTNPNSEQYYFNLFCEYENYVKKELAVIKDKSELLDKEVDKFNKANKEVDIYYDEISKLEDEYNKKIEFLNKPIKAVTKIIDKYYDNSYKNNKLKHAKIILNKINELKNDKNEILKLNNTYNKEYTETINKNKNILLSKINKKKENIINNKPKINLITKKTTNNKKLDIKNPFAKDNNNNLLTKNPFNKDNNNQKDGDNKNIIIEGGLKINSIYFNK